MEMGVPAEKAEEVLTRILESATSAGFIVELRGKRYIHLEGDAPGTAGPEEKPEYLAESETTDEKEITDQVGPEALRAAHQIDEARRKRVFISHGKNKAIIPPMKKLLEYGELQPVVSIERPSVSKPVPEKVMGEMRSCGAGIIHVEAERTIIDKRDEEHVILNPNVLIEIGAAMAFYGRRFILLVREGVKLPSNLQGLYEVRYHGDSLDADVTIRLLEAIKDIKNYPLPGEGDTPTPK
jgi:predicted nucleotide-binding protein